MDEAKGVFTAPEEGEYEVAFTGLLKSYGGRRVWATLYKIDKEDQVKGIFFCKTKKNRCFSLVNYFCVCFPSTGGQPTN